MNNIKDTHATTSKQKLSYLFREQCFESSFSEKLGSTANHNGLFKKATTLGTFSFATALMISLLLHGTYTKKTTTNGILSPKQHTAHATSTANGVVDEILIREGDTVKAGQYLFKISQETFSSTGSTAALTIKKINEQIQIAKIKKKAMVLKYSHELLQIEQKKKELSARTTSIQSEIKLLQQLSDSKRENFEKLDLLAIEGAVSLSARDDIKNDYLSLEIELEKTRQKKKQLIFETSELPIAQKSLFADYELSMAELDNDLLLLKRELIQNETSKNSYIASPISGTISAINSSAGQSVTLGTVLASVFPEEDELQAHLYVPPEGIGFVDIGQRTNIRISAYPFQKFGTIHGYVSNVSQTPYRSSDIPMEAVAAVDINKTYYKVTVTIDRQNIEAEGTARALKSGLIVEADLLMDKRKLYEWLLSPMYSFTKKQS